jgi:hypothetical protein
MQESDWDQVVRLAEDLNSNQALQDEFYRHPKKVLEDYGLEVTEDELQDIRRLLKICAEHTTLRCVFPLERQRIRRNGEEDDEES